MLFHVYKEDVPDDYYANEPFGIYRALLDADWVLWILLPLLLVIIVIALMVGWHLHEIPKHRAQHKELRQAELVSALTLLGLFQHWVWAIALFIAYLDWNAFEETMVRILSRARTTRTQADQAAQPVPASVASDVAEAPPAEPVLVEEVSSAPPVETDPFTNRRVHR